MDPGKTQPDPQPWTRNTIVMFQGVYDETVGPSHRLRHQHPLQLHRDQENQRFREIAVASARQLKY